MKSYNRFLKECTIVLSGLGVLLSSLKLLLRFLASCFDNGSLGSPLGSPLGPLGSLPSLAFLASFTSLLSSLLLPLRVCQFIQHSLFYINTSCFQNYSNSPVFQLFGFPITLGAPFTVRISKSLIFPPKNICNIPKNYVELPILQYLTFPCCSLYFRNSDERMRAVPGPCSPSQLRPFQR